MKMNEQLLIMSSFGNFKFSCSILFSKSTPKIENKEVQVLLFEFPYKIEHTH